MQSITKLNIMKIIISLAAMLLPLVPMSTEASTSVSAAKAAKTVYVCTGPYAKRYHYSKDCSGLGRCSCEIKKMSKAQAIKNGWSTGCQKCT